MPGFGFGFGYGRRRSNEAAIIIPEPTVFHQFGALSRNSFGAGIPTSATGIVAGDAGGHWTLSGGRLYPSEAGDLADLNAGPYVLLLDNGEAVRIDIEPDTWDVAEQSEWDFVANQSASTLAGKTVALRHNGELALGIDGTLNSPFRNGTFEDAAGNPCTVRGRSGASGNWADYCLIDKVAAMRGAVGVRFEHVRTTPVAETKFGIISQTSGGNVSGNVSIHDCWITGQVGDPNGDYSISTDYPNFGVDLINTGGKTGEQGSISITNCLIEWGGTLCSISVDGTNNSFTFSGNEARFFYGDAVQASNFNGRAAAEFVCTNNFIHSCVGRADDSGNSHADSIRVQGSTTATADYAITIEDNVILPGNARGDAQGIFMDDMKSGGVDSGHFFVATIRNNIVQVVDTSHGLTIGQPKDCLIEQNTVIGNNGDNAFTVFIATAGGSQGTDGGGTIAQNNIAEAINLTAGTSSGDFELGLNGADIPYATLLAGPTWSPTTAEDAKSLFLPKVTAGAAFGPRINSAPILLGPTIEGTAEDGEVLTAIAQAAAFPGPSISYQWRKNGVDMAGEVGPTLTLNAVTQTLVSGDLLSCEITASNAEGTASSEPVIGFVAQSAQYLIQGAVPGYFFDPIKVPAGTSRITYRGSLYWPAGTISNGQRPFNINSTGCDLALLGNGGLQVTVEDSTFAKVVSSVSVPGLALSEDTWYTIIFDVDQVAETAIVNVNGIDHVIPFTIASSGAFQTGQRVGLMGSSAGLFTVAPGVRFADLSVDFNGVLHKAISNNPVVANADPWHAGGDLIGGP